MAFPLSSGVTTPAIFPTGSATPSPAYSGTFIPEIWSGKLIEKFYNATVLSAISNTNYEGEIKNQGDKVIIRTRPSVTIRDYKADGALTVERPSSNVVELLIDKGKYWNTILDDVMETQADINMMSLWAEDAAEQMKIVIDTDVLLGILNQASADNRGTTAGVISNDVNLGVTTTPLALVADAPGVGEVSILDMILRLGQVLDEQNVPETGRYLVMPMWATAMIKRSELRQAYLSGDSVSMLRNGRVGMIDRFTLYASNLLPAGVAGGLAAGEYAIYAGHSQGLTFASQIAKTETLRSESTFGQLMRGLNVYGYKVIDNKLMAEAIVSKA
jgi:hypothetical protein